MPQPALSAVERSAELPDGNSESLWHNLKSCGADSPDVGVRGSKDHLGLREFYVQPGRAICIYNFAAHLVVSIHFSPKEVSYESGSDQQARWKF